MRRLLLRRLCACLALTGLGACSDGLTQVSAPPPRPASLSPAVVAVAEPAAPQSPASRAASEYYAAVQKQLLAQGLLRTDGGGPDTPFDDRMLTENFLRIALFDEYQRTSLGPVAQETESRLRRWDVPVRVGLRFGDSVPADRRASDTARMASYLARLAAITGHPIALDDHKPNYFVYFVNEDERKALGPTVAAAMPSFNAAEIADITGMPRETYCLVSVVTAPGSSAYHRAFAVIRAEHPDLLRLSCLHEELAQGLGLANDSPRARPSIFNDDEEFALLTGQDEQMLRMLYNPALRPGMTLAEARPIATQLARTLLGGES